MSFLSMMDIGVRSAQPQLNRLLAFRWGEGQWHLLARPRAFVGGEDDLQRGSAVLARLQRFFEARHAVDEVLVLLREAEGTLTPYSRRQFGAAPLFPSKDAAVEWHTVQ